MKHHEGEESCASGTVESSITDADALIFLMITASVVIIVKTNRQSGSTHTSVQLIFHAPLIRSRNLLPYQHRF